MWNPVIGKKRLSHSHTVLTARASYGQWHYEVLVHWPDGVWTDQCENEVDEDEIPTLWQEIKEPFVS